jgi:hypothetical protein
MASQHIPERGIEQRFEVSPQGFLQIPGIEQRGQLVRQRESHGRAAGRHEAQWRRPLPRRPVPRRQVPSGGHRCRAAPGFGNHLARHEQAKLDPDAGESDAVAALLRACRNIVVACQLSALHAPAIVDDRQCRSDCIGQQANAGRTRVKCIRDHFGEDRFFERPGVGITQVFEEVLQVDACLTHRRILSRGRILNCAALPEQLLESQLLGYERGAFTTAHQAKPGQIELAASGVLFLDEVTAMSLTAQAKFLRVLPEREFQRLGGTRIMKANIRVIAATNRDLRKAVERGDFREDLYYRLTVFDVAIAPLRERTAAHPPPGEALLHDIGQSFGRDVGTGARLPGARMRTAFAFTSLLGEKS